MALAPKFVGMPIQRWEDPRLTTGTATYMDDLHMPGQSRPKVQDISKKIAAQTLEAAPADMVFETGRIYVRGSPNRAVTFIQVARAAYRGLNLPPDTEPEVEATSSFEPLNFTFPFGAPACVVEVEKPARSPVPLRS